MKTRNSLLLFSIAVFATFTAEADVVVIANPSIKISGLDATTVKRLFLGKDSNLADGTAVELADQTEGDTTREKFYADVIGKNPIQLKAYWAKRVFSGKGMPPVVIGDDRDVVQWVSKTNNAIGYVDSGAVNDTVKTLFNVK